MPRTTRVILQPQKILRVPCKMNLMIDPHHIWNVIYNARSNKSHPPTSPNVARATHNESYDWSASPAYERSFTMRGATRLILQLHQRLRLPRNMNLMIDPHYIWKRHLQCAEQQESSFNFTKDCACHATWTSWLIRITFETSFTMRGATRVILQLHQRLRLPRNMNLMIDPHHIWNVIYTARSNRHHLLTSPNFAPATQNDRPTSDRNLLKTAVKDHFQCATDPSPFRAWSETVPSMIRPWKRKPQPASPPRILFALARSRCYWKLQHACLAPAIFQILPNAAPATKSDTWTSPNAAPATKSDTWTPPNARIDERLGPRPGPSRRACNLKTSGGGYLRRTSKGLRHNPHLPRPHRPTPHRCRCSNYSGRISHPKSARPRLAWQGTAIWRTCQAFIEIHVFKK